MDAINCMAGMTGLVRCRKPDVPPPAAQGAPREVPRSLFAHEGTAVPVELGSLAASELEAVREHNVRHYVYVDYLGLLSGSELKAFESREVLGRDFPWHSLVMN